MINSMFKNNNRFTSKVPETKKGFTLFVAVLVAALVLAIGFSIGNIALKQLMIAGSGGGSLVAFYAADSAIECATYWDRKDHLGNTWQQSPFGTTTLDISDFDHTATGLCGGSEGRLYDWRKTCDVDGCGPASVAATTTFAIDFKDPDDPSYIACAYVAVAKRTDPITSEETTSITARGYNTDLMTATGECNLGRQRVVERGLLQNY